MLFGDKKIQGTGEMRLGEPSARGVRRFRQLVRRGIYMRYCCSVADFFVSRWVRELKIGSPDV